MFIDSHAHMYFDKFDDDLDDVIKKHREAQVTKVIVPAIDINTGYQAIKLAKKYDGYYAACGIHPSDIPDDIDVLDELLEQLKNTHVVALGEIGLDYYWDTSKKEEQKKFFKAQLEIAKKLDLPVIIHNRSADEDVVKVLKEVDNHFKGVFHCYAGDEIMAKELIRMGFYISFTGNITFKKTDRIEALKSVPLERLLLETDSPFITPHPHRGKRNDPSYIPLIAEKIAEIKEISLEEVAEVTTKNAIKLFSLA